MRSLKELFSRFQSLQRLNLSPLRRIPYVAQNQYSDCGPACLTMILRHYGQHVELQELIHECGTYRQGTNAQVILNVARRHGLIGRGVRLPELKDLMHLPKGSMLHWRFHHYVIFEKYHKNHIEVIDPASGRRSIPMSEVDSCFTGIALTFSPTKEFKTKGSSEFARLKPFFSVLFDDTTVFTRILITSLVLQIFQLGLPLFTGTIVDRIIPRHDFNLLWVVIAGLILISSFRFLCSMIRGYSLLYLRVRLDSSLTFNFLHHLISLPFEFFDRRRTGDLVVKMNSNRAVRDILTSSSLTAVLDGSMLALTITVLCSSNLRLANIVLAFAALQILVYWFTRKYYHENHIEQLAAQSRSHGLQFQMLNAMEALKSSGREHTAAGRWGDAYVDELNVLVRQGKLQAWTESLRDALLTFGPICFLAFGADLVLKGEISLGLLLAMSMLASNVLTPLNKLLDAGYEMQRLKSFTERLKDVFDTPMEKQDRAWQPPPQLRGEIAVKNISFRYEPHGPLILNDVSFTAEPGEFIGIVGHSGSGKSSLARLLTGLYLPEAGHIEFDQIDIKLLDLETTRQQIGVVTQQSYLLQGSLRDNIAISGVMDGMEDIISAAKAACIHDDIIKLPLGYSTQVSEGGGSLSGGQKQRISLARALYTKPPILILDEATSALDNVTEVQVYKAIEALSVTRIVIAHRLNTVRHADKIIVLSSGKIVEQGSHDELMGLKGEYYKLNVSSEKGLASSHVSTDELTLRESTKPIQSQAG